jgi:hypothetical protein
LKRGKGIYNYIGKNTLNKINKKGKFLHPLTREEMKSKNQKIIINPYAKIRLGNKYIKYLMSQRGMSEMTTPNQVRNYARQVWTKKPINLYLKEEKVGFENMPIMNFKRMINNATGVVLPIYKPKNPRNRLLRAYKNELPRKEYIKNIANLSILKRKFNMPNKKIQEMINNFMNHYDEIPRFYPYGLK